MLVECPKATLQHQQRLLLSEGIPACFYYGPSEFTFAKGGREASGFIDADLHGKGQTVILMRSVPVVSSSCHGRGRRSEVDAGRNLPAPGVPSAGYLTELCRADVEVRIVEVCMVQHIGERAL